MKQVTFFKSIYLTGAFALVALFAQAQQEQKEKKVFVFEVKGMRSEKDARSLDSLMLTKKGIYSSQTDFKTKMITVKTIPQLDFLTVKSVLTVLRLEATNEKLKESTEKSE